MPISLNRCSAMKAIRPKSPRQAMRIEYGRRKPRAIRAWRRSPSYIRRRSSSTKVLFHPAAPARCVFHDRPVMCPRAGGRGDRGSIRIDEAEEAGEAKVEEHRPDRRFQGADVEVF